MAMYYYASKLSAIACGTRCRHNTVGQQRQRDRHKGGGRRRHKSNDDDSDDDKDEKVSFFKFILYRHNSLFIGYYGYVSLGKHGTRGRELSLNFCIIYDREYNE